MIKKSKFYKVIIKYFPVIEWSQNYKLSYLHNDIIAGLSVGLTLIPQGLAYGSVAGLKPEFGLFAAFWGPFIYFFLGTSKDLTIGPTAILSLLVAHYSLASNILFDITYAVLLSLMSGCIQLILGLFSLGFIANYMSPTVVSGFTTSAAILIGWGQVKTLFGLKHVRSSFFLSVYDIFKNIANLNKADFVCGLSCIVVLLIFKILNWHVNSSKVLSGFQRTMKSIMWFMCICANILVIIISSLVAYYLKQIKLGHLSLTGHIESGLPRFEVPRFQITNNTVVIKSTAEIFKDIETGIPIVAFIALIEAMAIGKAFARQNCYKIRSSQEFIAIGVSNIVGSFFQCLPTTGSFSRTAINSQSMSKSPFSGVITGALILLALQFLTPYFIFIPNASLAAIIIVAVMFMTDFKFVYRTWKLKKYDCFTWFLTFLISLALGVEYGVLIGIGFSFLPIVFTASRPKFEIVHNSAQFKGSFLWFPFISKLTAMIDSIDTENRNYVFLDLTGVYSADSAIINTLSDVAHDFDSKKKTLVVIINNLHIAQILQGMKFVNGGIECFRSYEEALESYPNFFDGSFLDDRIPLLSVFQDHSNLRK